MNRRFLLPVFVLLLVYFNVHTKASALVQRAVATTAISSDSVPHVVKFSGSLRDGSGGTVTGTVGVVFAVYSASEGGAALWQETQSVAADSAGKYSVLLGAGSAEGISQEVFSSGEARWLGVGVDGVEQPRTLLVSVPYALKAADAETLGGKPLSAFDNPSGWMPTSPMVWAAREKAISLLREYCAKYTISD